MYPLFAWLSRDMHGHRCTFYARKQGVLAVSKTATDSGGWQCRFYE